MSQLARNFIKHCQTGDEVRIYTSIGNQYSGIIYSIDRDEVSLASGDGTMAAYQVKYDSIEHVSLITALGSRIKTQARELMEI